MTEQTRKKIVYLVFVAAVIYGAVNFLGRGGGKTAAPPAGQEIATVQPIIPGGENLATIADTTEWGRDPFAQKVASTHRVLQSETLRLSAISGSDENPLAVINGKILALGESIDGWQVTRIQRKSVQLQRNGKSKTLILGEE